MLIKFDEIQKTEAKNFYGGIGIFNAKIYFDGMNKIIHGKLNPGDSIGVHTHETSSEIIYILSGNGKVLYDDSYEELTAGSCHYCPKGHSHSLINNSDAELIFFAVVPEQ